MRDLQALLTSANQAGAAEILRAFNLVCWMLPIVEDGGAGLTMQNGTFATQICTKASSHPLEGFSGCRAGAVWASLPHTLQSGVSGAMADVP